MDRRDQEYRHQRDIHHALQQAQRARVLVLVMLQVEGEPDQPGADQEADQVPQPRNQRYASNRPHAITPIHIISDSAACSLAEGGVATATFQRSTERYGPRWKNTALIAAAKISVSFSTNARFVMKSSACAMNMRSPVGTIRSSAPSVHGSRCRDNSLTGTRLDSPSSLRSSIAIDPTSITKPQIWTISTDG